MKGILLNIHFCQFSLIKFHGKSCVLMSSMCVCVFWHSFTWLYPNSEDVCIFCCIINWPTINWFKQKLNTPILLPQNTYLMYNSQDISIRVTNNANKSHGYKIHSKRVSATKKRFNLALLQTLHVMGGD